MHKRLYFISFFLLFLFSLHIQAIGTSEKITLSFSNLTLSEAIKKIESVSNYSFFYDVNKTNLQQRVSLNAKDLAIEDALTQLLKTTDLTFNVTNRQIALIPRETPTVVLTKATGTVTDDSGQPIIGANIMEKGTNNGTVSDLDGEFTLQIPAGATLVVSYIGCVSREVQVRNSQPLDIILREDSQNLNEVIVVGYGIQKKSVVTAAISRVTSKDLSNSTPTRIEDVLKGKVSGVQITQNSGQPGTASQVRVRGIGTINNSDPLFIVDGMPINSGIDFLNPKDIESIEVLKDAASAAIYGARAAN